MTWGLALYDSLALGSDLPYVAEHVPGPGLSTTRSRERTMPSAEDRPPIREEDVEARTIRRRTFLGRFGAAAGVAGFLGWTVGCEGTDSCDEDEGDEIVSDSDQSDDPVVDSDFGDPCDSDGV